MRRRATVAFLIALGVLVLGVGTAAGDGAQVGRGGTNCPGGASPSIDLGEADVDADYDYANDPDHPDLHHITGWSLAHIAHGCHPYSWVDVAIDGVGGVTVFTRDQLRTGNFRPVFQRVGATLHLIYRDRNGVHDVPTDNAFEVSVFNATVGIDTVDHAKVGDKVRATAEPVKNAPDGTLTYSWDFGGSNYRVGRTVHAPIGRTGAILLTVTLDGATIASKTVTVTLDKKPPPKPDPESKGPNAGAGGGASPTAGEGGTGYGTSDYGTTAYTPPVAGAAAVTSTPTTQTTTRESTPTTATPAPTSTPAPTAAFNPLLGAPNPPLTVTTTDPVVSGELLSGPNAAAAAAAAAGGGGGTGTRTVTTPAMPTAATAVRPPEAQKHHSDSGLSIPNAAWEIALLLLIVGLGWWVERRNATAPPTVSLP